MDTSPAAPKTPKTQREAIRFFADHVTGQSFLVGLRWPDGNVACPTCGRTDVTYLSKYRRWKCRTRHPRQQFSIKVGTLFEDSPIGLDKWLPAVWMITNAKKGVSSYDVARALGVRQKTGWFMLHRIRLARGDGALTNRRGRVEADETHWRWTWMQPPRGVPPLALPWIENGDASSRPPEPRPGTPYQRFVEATKRVLSVSKQELAKREKAWRRQRAREPEREKRR